MIDKLNISFKAPDFIIVLKKFYDIYAYKHLFHIVLLFLGAIIAGVFEIIGIIGLYFMVKLLIKIDRLALDHPLNKIFLFFDLQTYEYQLLFLGLSIAGIFIGKNIFIILYYLFQHKTLRVWKSELSSIFMRGYLNAPYSFLLGYNSSTILRNINSIVSSALNGFILAAINFMANIVTGTIILSLIYSRYFSISLLIAAILITSTILQNLFLKKKAQKLGEQRDKLIEKQNQNVYQGIHAIKETKVLGKEDFFMSSFDKLNSSSVKNDSASMLLGRLPSHITEIVIIISIVIICIAVLIDPANAGSNSIASLGVLAAIAFRIAPIMNRTLSSLQSMNKNTSSINTMFNELKKLKHYEEQSKTSLEKIDFKEKITFKNVSYKYPKTKKFALNDISFEINKGEFIGIVGASGAGKTTVVDILLGLLEPTKGNICIDNTPLKFSNMRSWQDKLAFVPQSIYLSDDSIQSNIAFGVNKKDIDVKKVDDVINKAHLDDLLNSKKEKKLFKIGENGKNLSGGQKQRLAIARALYYDSDILVLDEATSALDLKTEFEVSKVLRSQAGDKTVIAIAHRLSTVYDADRIIYMEDGKVVSVGSFDSLVNENLRFKELAELSKISR